MSNRSFDLTASWPLTSNGTSRYFPLRHAQNETQYVLGRTFLQQAYLIVDYDRNNFSVSQALLSDTDVAQNLFAIDPPTTDEKARPFSTGMIIGVACAAAVLIVCTTVTVIFLKRRRSSLTHSKSNNGSQDSFAKSELDASICSNETITFGRGLHLAHGDSVRVVGTTEIDALWMKPMVRLE